MCPPCPRPPVHHVSGTYRSPHHPPTEWAKLNGIFTTPALPVEIRDSLSSISTFVAAIGNSSQNTTTIYNVPSLALLGSTGTGADATSALFTAKFQALPFSDPATGLVYARARWYSPETGTFLSGDPLAYKDSSNLYSFAGGDPVNGRDPSGLLCEAANASGFWNWVGRCTQDAISVQEEFNRGVFSLKTPGRAVAGVVGTAKMIGKAAIGTAALVIDQKLAEGGDVNAMMRQGQRVAGIANAVRHPIDTVVDAHTKAADKILTQEQSGHWFQASTEAGEIASADAAAVVGAAEAGVGLARLGTRVAARIGVAEAEGAAGGIQFGPATDEFLTNASRATPNPGVLDVAVHGSPVNVEIGSATVNHRVLARLIEQNSEFTGQPIRLLSCETGCLPRGFAQNLSNKLGVPVSAPNDIIWAYPDGQLTIGQWPTSNTGSFINFLPGGGLW